jgi:large subunit ribosomal protein L35
MPKLKPHKGLLKRVKVTARGKILRRKAGKRHLMASKTGARRRRLGRAGVVGNAAFVKIIRRQLALE